MDQLPAMRSFVRVVEAGSFSAVAREAHTTQPAISKQVAWLEARLGARLLERTTRKVALTDEGALYYEKAKAILDAVDEAEAAVRKGRQQVAGVLRVACSVGFGRFQVVPRLADFLARYPQLRIDLRMSDAFIDLIEEGIDVAIRIGALADSSLIARRIGTTHRVVVASPKYLKGRPRPRSPRDLQAHECIVYSALATMNEWRFEREGRAESVRVDGRFRCSSAEGVREAALAGLGIAWSPVWLFGDELRSKTLVTLLPEWRSPPLPIHAVSPPSRRHSPRVNALVEYLEGGFRGDPFVTAYPG